MEPDFDDTDYVQLNEDTDEKIDLGHEEADVAYLGMPRRSVGGVDMRSVDLDARKLDMMGVEVEDNVYAWSGSFDAEVDVSHGSMDNLYLRSADGDDLIARGTAVRDRAEFSRAEFDTVDLSGAAVDLLHVEDAAVEEFDLSGASVGELQVDQDYGFVVDEGTVFDEVPEGLEGITVYQETTLLERDAMYAVLDGSFDEKTSTDPRYAGAAGSLQRKKLFDAETYELTDRGEAFAGYL
ncbi:MAG: hypothetical protein SV186_00790 [Candidatus Nanohaloarchaea archaeon]|nr:hypothetical protein [Candidatus Nanohaloarchaea archaeon]